MRLRPGVRFSGILNPVDKDSLVAMERIANSAPMYGGARGIVGTSVPPVPALELDTVAGGLEEVTAELS